MGGQNTGVVVHWPEAFHLYMGDPELADKAAEIANLVRDHDDEQLLRRTEAKIKRHIKQGQSSLLFRVGGSGEELVGAAIADLSRDDERVEVAHTVVARQHRGGRKAELLAAAAIVSQAMHHPSFEAIFATVHPRNEACISALEKLEAPPCAIGLAEGSSRAMDRVIAARRARYVRKGWTEEPLIAVITPEVVQHCSQLMVAALAPTGLAWDNGSRVYLHLPEPGDTPPEEALVPQLRAMAAGVLPTIRLRIPMGHGRVQMRA